MVTHSCKVNKKGMVTIPFKLREKYSLQEGTEVTFIEELGNIILVPIIDIKNFRDFLPSRDQMQKNIDENRVLELKLENDE